LVTLRLPADWALRRQVHFPAATRENLGRVIGFEMDRLTPFTLDQVWYDFRVTGEAAGSAELIVDLVVLPRQRVAPWLAVLAAAGIRPAKVDMAGLWPRANLLPQAQRPTRSRRENTLNGALLGVLVGLLAVALVFPLWQKRRVVVDLNERVASEKRQADVVMSIRERLDQSEELLRFAPDRRQANPPVLDTLNLLTRLLPDHTWVQQLEFRNDVVELRGTSQQATALLQLLEGSNGFTQVGFRSPVLQNQGQENFHLAAKVLATSPGQPVPAEAAAAGGASPAPVAPSAGMPPAQSPPLPAVPVPAMVSGV
jgi:general secretion pathway protein L